MVFEFVTSLISSKNFSLTCLYFLQFIMKCSSFSISEVAQTGQKRTSAGILFFLQFLEEEGGGGRGTYLGLEKKKAERGE